MTTEVPTWFLNILVVSIIGFVFRVIFGLINKNEEKSDKADVALEKEADDNYCKLEKKIDDDIKSLRFEINEMKKESAKVKDYFANNDKQIFMKTENMRVDDAVDNIRLQCLRETVNDLKEQIQLSTKKKV